MLDFKNKLIIGTAGTDTSFLGEADVPGNARLNGPLADASHEKIKTQMMGVTGDLMLPRVDWCA